MSKISIFAKYKLCLSLNMTLTTKNRLIESILVFTLFAVIPLLWTNKTLDPSMHIQFCSLAFCLTFFYSVHLFRNKNVIIENKNILFFLITFIGFIFYSIISMVISINASDSLFLFAKYLLFFILFITFAFFFKSQNVIEKISHPILILNIIILIFGYAQLLSLVDKNELIIPLSTYNICSIFPHRNLFSEILLLTIPFNIFQYFSKKSIWKYLGIINFNLALLLIIVLSNRATWLAVLFSGGIIFIIAYIKEKRVFINKLRIFFFTNTLLILLFGGLIFIGFSDTASLKTHALNSIDFNIGSTKDRLELWERTLKLIDEKPLLGGGLESWKINMLKYGNKGLASENNTTFYQRPHNDFLWVTAEQGLIGVVLYIGLFSIILFQLIRLALKKNDKDIDQQLLVILFITLVYIVFSCFSFPKERVEHNILIFSAWGIFINILNSSQSTNSKFPIKFNYVYIFSIFLVGILFIGICRLIGEVHTKNAILAKTDSDFKKCIKEIECAKSYFYKFDQTSTPLDWYSGLSYYNLKDYSQAINHFKLAYHLNPYHIYVLNDYASCLVKLNQNDEAIQQYKKAIEIAPNFTDAQLNLCALYYMMNNNIEAFKVLKGVDIKTSTDRYKKTVITLVRKFIDNYLKNWPLNDKFMVYYKKEFNNYAFYNALLVRAIQSNLQPDEMLEVFAQQL